MIHKIARRTRTLLGGMFLSLHSGLTFHLRRRSHLNSDFDVIHRLPHAGFAEPCAMRLCSLFSLAPIYADSDLVGGVLNL